MHATIKLGTSGDFVRLFQRGLNQNGENLSVDGVFSPEVGRAIERFQIKKGLPVTGHMDPRTFRALGYIEQPIQKKEEPKAPTPVLLMEEPSQEDTPRRGRKRQTPSVTTLGYGKTDVLNPTPTPVAPANSELTSSNLR